MRRDKILCTAGVCSNFAADISKQIKVNTTAVNLCDNFESFVCEGWRQTHSLRPEQGQMSYDNLLSDRATDIMRAYLNSSTPPVDTPADRQSFGLVKTAYETCLNETELKRVGMAPLSKMLDDVAKLFPVNASSYSTLNSTTMKESDGVNFRELELYLARAGLGGFVEFSPGRDDKQPSVRVVFVTPPSSLTLGTEYYKDNQTMASYLSVMTQVLGATHPSEVARGKAAQIAKQIIEFESRVSAVLPPIDDLSDVSLYYNPMSLSDTTKLAPVLGLDYVLKELSPKNVSNERLITSFPNVIKSMNEILLSTSKETIQSYYIWRILYWFNPRVRASEIEPARIFDNTLSGRDPTAFPERWRECMNHVKSDGTLEWILGRFYASQYFSEKSKKVAESIVTYMKQQYAKDIQSLDWLDDSVKATALKKLERMDVLMGFPDKLPVNVSDPVAVLDFYKGLNLTNSFFDNAYNMMVLTTARSWSKLGTPYLQGEWLMSPETVNAYNNPNGNEIAFPAAILQAPYFDADLPSYVNFAVTGFTVGHEVSHGFDYHGRQYGVDGAFGDSWWTNRTDAEFRKKSQCFIEQYGNFTVPGLDGKPLHIDGKQTLDENIADVGGVDTSFLAWQQYRKDFPALDMDLPGLEGWSHEQLFFVSYANSWCSKWRDNALVKQIVMDPHSPAQFRVTGPLQDSRSFRETFNCPSKEPTCKIW